MAGTPREAASRSAVTVTGLVVGNKYTLSTNIASDFGNGSATGSSAASVVLQFGTVTSPTYTTQTSQIAGTSLGTSGSQQTTTNVTLSAYTATATSATFKVTLRVVRGTVGDDIGVGQPTLTCMTP